MEGRARRWRRGWREDRGCRSMDSRPSTLVKRDSGNWEKAVETLGAGQQLELPRHKWGNIGSMGWSIFCEQYR